MKYVITGSIGNISKPLTKKLIDAGHIVSVISSSISKKEAIENMGANALIGSVENEDFVNEAFASADAIYLMIPPTFATIDWMKYQNNIADNYVKALEINNIKNVVVLSSVGADLGKGAGPVDGLAYLEHKLTNIKGLNVVNLRPGYFYTNLFQQIGMIRHAGIMGSAQPAEHKMVLSHYNDIADAAFEELNQLNFTGQSYKYIISDERSWKDINQVLTSEVGKTGVPFISFDDEQNRKGMEQAKLPKTIIEGYVAMGKSMREKIFDAHYFANRPEPVGKIKLEEFAKEFARAYQNS